MSKKAHTSKRGVSPVVATIVLVAVTLVAAVSVGGYISGLFGGFTATQSISAATLFAGSVPILSFTVTNTGTDVNITTISTSGPGISGVYTWTPTAAWQFNNAAKNGASSFTLTADVPTDPDYVPIGSNSGTAYTIVINFANGRAVTQSLIGQ